MDIKRSIYEVGDINKGIGDIKRGIYEVGNGIYKVNGGKKVDDIFVVGDLHGDYQVLVHVLVDLCECCEITSIYNDTENSYSNRELLSWLPNIKKVVVFCGDLIHRKRFNDHILDDECSDVYIIETILRLKKEAKKQGGDIILILGNHEVMNIIQPENEMYTSPKNIKKNRDFFTNTDNVTMLVNNSYAWVKINDILISHGGLCSDYFLYIESYSSKFDKTVKGEALVSYVNNEFRKFFGNGTYLQFVAQGGKGLGVNGVNGVNGALGALGALGVNGVNGALGVNGVNGALGVNGAIGALGVNGALDGGGGGGCCNNSSNIGSNGGWISLLITSQLKGGNNGYELFVKQDLSNKKSHNMFWCREWGYSGIDCTKFKEIISKVECSKSIIAHCPQFLSPDKPKMINFECKLGNCGVNESYGIARIDIGMSRCFEYNLDNNFLYYLGTNYNRKISILKLLHNEKSGDLYFNYSSIITMKISCIQYLLLKYGLCIKDWNDKKQKSNWNGFKYIDRIVNNKNYSNNDAVKLELQRYSAKYENNTNILYTLLYPIKNKLIQNLKSVVYFNNLIHKKSVYKGL